MQNVAINSVQAQDWDGDVIVSQSDGAVFMQHAAPNAYYLSPTDRPANAYVCDRGAWHWDGTACDCPVEETRTMEQTHWRDLVVTDTDGQTGTLGDLVDHCPANLDNAKIDDGAIEAWEGFMLSAPGEEPDWDTPRGAVDWSGFADALNTARGQA